MAVQRPVYRRSDRRLSSRGRDAVLSGEHGKTPLHSRQDPCSVYTGFLESDKAAYGQLRVAFHVHASALYAESVRGDVGSRQVRSRSGAYRQRQWNHYAYCELQPAKRHHRNGKNGIPRNFSYGQNWYFAPTAGFAWDVFGDNKTALRGGYGAAQSRVFTGIDCTYNCANNYPFVQSITLINPQFPSPLGTGTAAPPAAPSLAGTDLHAKASTVHSYSLTLEHQFPGWLVSAGFSGD